MTRTIQIQGTGLTANLRLCHICPGKAEILASRFKDHMENHALGGVLVCVKCGKSKLIATNFPKWVHYKAPICHACRPKVGIHHKGRPSKTSKDHYRLRNPVVLNSGHGRPPQKEKIIIRVGKVGMGASTRS